MKKELLKQLLIGAEKAHAAYENSIGGKHADWPEFYAQYMSERLTVVGPVPEGDAYCGSPVGFGDEACL